MSRTFHNIATKCFRNMKVQNFRKNEEDAILSLESEDVPIRHVNRLKSFMTQTPDANDDIIVSSNSEFHNKEYWKKRRELAKKQHFTKKQLKED